MKAFKTLALVFALILVLGACSSRNNGSSSSVVPPASSAQSQVSSVPPAASSLPGESSKPHESSKPNESSKASTPAMSTDFAEIGALSSKKLGWGPGGPVDQLNRSSGAVAYQEKYGKYNADFIGPETSKTIYLTFDEGYENGYTEKILDVLKEKNVSAVFFVTMPYVKSNPELVQRMIDEGHIVGNHSDKHLSFPTMPLAEAKEDVMRLHDYMKSEFNYEMTLFRFPMGEFSEQMLALMKSCNYRSVFWSFAYKDWLVDDQPDHAAALEKIKKSVHPGAIYLLHAVSKTNTEILGRVIDDLRSDGYTFSKYDL